VGWLLSALVSICVTGCVLVWSVRFATAMWLVRLSHATTGPGAVVDWWPEPHCAGYLVFGEEHEFESGECGRVFTGLASEIDLFGEIGSTLC
jgi:hypothetical protein